MKISLTIILLTVFYLNTYSQGISIMPGLYINTMFGSSQYPMGIGGALDVDYKPNKINFISIAVRGKIAYYSYNDNSNINYDDNGNINSYNANPKLKYNITIPQISIVPKFYYSIDDDIQLYIENDFSYGFISGNIDYIFSKEYSKKVNNISKNIFIYTPSIGAKIRFNNVGLLFYLGWSFLDFNSIIKDNKPKDYNYEIG